MQAEDKEKREMMESDYDVIVVGGSAAGLSAALMLGRARRSVLVIDAGSPRNRYAAHMHGVLGHDGVDPAVLVAKGRQEAEAYGVEFIAGTVEILTEDDGAVTVLTSAGDHTAGRAAIVASGVTDRLPEIPGLAERWGKTVLHCPYCHGWEVRDQRLAVLTTSPLGLHQAELIRQWSDRLVVFTAGLEPLDPATERRLRARDIGLVRAPVVEVLGDGDRVTAVRTSDGEVTEVDAIFTAGTTEPNDGFLMETDLDRADGLMGSFLTVDSTGKTSSDRIWAVGNVADPAANVPMSISAGAVAAGTVNMALITAEFDYAAMEADHERV
jgi:thioredoxin reductase